MNEIYNEFLDYLKYLGIYGYPKDEACKIAIDTIKEYTSDKIKVKFVCYEEVDYKLYLNYLNGIDKGVFEL